MNPGSDRPTSDDNEKPQLGVFALAELGSLNAVSLLAGFGVGWLVDSYLETTPIFIFVGLLAGAGCGVFVTYRRIRRYL